MLTRPLLFSRCTYPHTNRIFVAVAHFLCPASSLAGRVGDHTPKLPAHKRGGENLAIPAQEPPNGQDGLGPDRRRLRPFRGAAGACRLYGALGLERVVSIPR